MVLAVFNSYCGDSRHCPIFTLFSLICRVIMHAYLLYTYLNELHISTNPFLETDSVQIQLHIITNQWSIILVPFRPNMFKTQQTRRIVDSCCLKLHHSKMLPSYLRLSPFEYNMSNGPSPSSPGLLYQNEVKCSALDIKMIFHSRTNETHFYKKGCALCLILKVRVSGTRKCSTGWQVIPV